MGDQVQLAPEVEQRVLLWKHGTIVYGSKVLSGDADVNLLIRSDLRAGGWRTGRLMMSMNPVIEDVQRSDGSVVKVQSFRYRDFDGRERRLSICSCCGDVARFEADDLAAWVDEGCRKCGMSISPVGYLGPCCNWHTFGSCLACPGTGAFDMPTGGLANSRAQSGPTNDAGPSANEQRSREERRVVPVDAEGAEV